MAHKLRQTHVKLKISGAYFGSSNPEFDASLTEVLTQINLALTTARCTAKTKNEHTKMTICLSSTFFTACVKGAPNIRN